MPLFARLRSHARSLFHRNQREDELQQEIAFHIAARADDLQRSGLSAGESLRRARIEFGAVETHRANVRRALGLRWLDELGGDLRYAARMLLRSKGFTAVAIGSLALGIGANTIIFSLAKSVLLNRLAVPQPTRLQILALVANSKSPSHGSWNGQVSTADGRRASASFSYPIYQLLADQVRADAHSPLQDIFGFQDGGQPTLTVDGHAEVVRAEMVTGNYFQQLAVGPALGRTLQPSDDVPGASAAVLSDAAWSHLFGRSPAVLGKSIQLNLVPFTIVGIMPPTFTGSASTQQSPDVFVPISTQPVLSPLQADHATGSLLDNKTMWWVETEARLRPGASAAAAATALQTWIERDIRATMAVSKDAVMPQAVLIDGSRGLVNNIRFVGFTFRDSILVLGGLAGFVLLLACANLANLLLARSASRQREISVRLALGASRGRVLRQVLTESLLLSSLGGIAGLALGYAGRNVIPHLQSPSWRTPSLSPRFDAGILLFTLAISLFTGILFGIAPAWQAMRTDANAGLKESSLAATRRRKGFGGKFLVAFQIALSMVLVIGAGLFARTLINLNDAPLGFRPDNLVLFDLQAPQTRYPAPQDVQLHERVEDRLARIPGVQSVAPVWIALVSNGQVIKGFQPTDMPKDGGMRDGMSYNNVGRSFFTTYRIPILAGRGFDSSDTSTSPRVAVINQAAARRIYHDANPIGKSFKDNDDAKTDLAYQIIGICADARYADLTEDPPPTVYTFYRQSERQQMMTYVLKTSMPANALLPQVRSAVAEIDKDLPVRDLRTQTAQIAQTVSQQTMLATLTAAFGILALVLACIGIYGLLAYDVARRTGEIGIRMALGARASQMLAMVLRETVWTAAAGILVGLAVSLWLARFVKSMLYGLVPNDPWVIAAAALLLLAVALLAGFGPARRAAHIEPMEALRHE